MTRPGGRLALACWTPGPGIAQLFSTSYGPTKSAIEALEPERRDEFHETWVAFAEQHREGDQIVHHREYLLTLGTRR